MLRFVKLVLNYTPFLFFQSFRRGNVDIQGTDKQIGFDLLLNDSRTIERDGQKINILGVENWGAARHFPKRGSLKEATKNAADS